MRIVVNLKRRLGIIKPMNAVNNGPAGSLVRGTGNAEKYAALKIPYARLHDSSFSSYYGGEFTVDVHRIFRDFSRDADDPAAYSFKSTDEYLNKIVDAGTKIFFRLGASIEHGEKRGTYPPPDNLKWAKICEKIIRHYNEGWADGFFFGIEYFEIWNEPDLRKGEESPTWQGTNEEFIEFFKTSLSYLKEKFPTLKIGGAAFSSIWNPRAREVIKSIAEANIPIDFISYHWYGKDVAELRATVKEAADFVKSVGLSDVLLILNEYNYVKGWCGEDWKYSLRMTKRLMGASFVAGVMALGQSLPVDMLMYYDARPSGMNGIFDTDTLEPLPTYHTLLMFREVKEYGGYVPTRQYLREGIYSVASTNGASAGIMITHFNPKESAPPTSVELDFRLGRMSAPLVAEYYLLDGEHNAECTHRETVSSDGFTLTLKIPNYSTYFIRLTKKED